MKNTRGFELTQEIRSVAVINYPDSQEYEQSNPARCMFSVHRHVNLWCLDQNH
jgi:hypothetical protein